MNFPETSDAIDFSAKSILDQLDFAWGIHAIPSLITNGHWGFGRGRISAFRSSKEWLILLELLVYYNGFGDFDVILYGYGNYLKKIGSDPYTTVKSPPIKFPSSEFGLHVLPSSSVDEMDDDWWCRDPFNVTVKLNGARRNIALKMDDYNKAKVNIHDSLCGDACLDRVLHVFRALVYYFPSQELFLSDEMLLRRLGHSVDLPLFLRLYEWSHPGLGNIHKPSDSPSFQKLALALESGLKQNSTSSEDIINSNWWNWPSFSDG